MLTKIKAFIVIFTARSFSPEIYDCSAIFLSKINRHMVDDKTALWNGTTETVIGK